MSSEALARLADAYGVKTGYEDWQGRHIEVPEASIRAVLAAMDVAVGSEPDPEAALAAIGRDRHRRLLPPTVVVRRGQPHEAQVELRVPAGDRAAAAVLEEDGATRELPMGEVLRTEALEGVRIDVTRLPLPDLPTGYHRLRVEAGRQQAEATLVVAPGQAPLPLGRRRTWGWMLQLYALRSQHSWGLGDLGDLSRLARWAGREHGADFVLVNPLHAAAPVTPVESSPYYPSSRRFANPTYLRIEDIPELARLDGAGAARVRELAARLRATNRSAQLERDAVVQAKQEALALLHAAPRTPAREEAFADFRRREGRGLEDFATYCALAERHGVPFQQWPEDLRHPGSSAVAAARAELADRVAFHTWLQWLCDTQLAAAQEAATDAGMQLGIVHDLAVGVDPGGADAWALAADLASRVTVGAPPDAFNQQGQDWRLPPLRPDRLAATGFAPFRDMLRSVLRHAGGIRVDHILGLARLWWIPDGAGPQEGAYVHYPADAMLGVLTLEAERAGAMVIGEDLGVVPQGIRESMAERAILGSRVLYFERKPWSSDLLPAGDYPQLALASVTTHDLPTAAGWWSDEGVRVQSALGLLGDASSEEAEMQRKNREKAAMRDLLRAEGLVGDDPCIEDLIVAMHAFLARTPSLLVAAMLNDAVGDLQQPNMPGTVDEYPNWRLPLGTPDGGGRRPLLLEDLIEHEGVRRLANALRQRRDTPGS
jgi:4-alpha-glucanotransferase